MKKIALLLCALLVIAGSLIIPANAEENIVKGDKLNDGVYSIEVKSSSSMFRIIDCQLEVLYGNMTATLTLSGTGYGMLYMGTGEEAEQATMFDYIYYVENDEGKYTYTIPVEALDKEIDCAAWSIRKEKWYDRKLVFKSDSLPDDAYKPTDYIGAVIPCALVISLAAGSVVALIIKKRSKEEQKDEA